MKLSYADLISPLPYRTNIGSIKSPTLREIWNLGYSNYQFYLMILSLSPKSYCYEVNKSLKNWFDGLSDEEKTSINMIDVCQIDSDLAIQLQKILDFSFIEDVTWNSEYGFFVVQKDRKDSGSIVGVINSNLWKDVCGIICQLNNITVKEDVSTIKSKKAKSIMEKILAGRKKLSDKKEGNKNYELDNAVSAIANRHPSINILNVWDLTISQFWDAFKRTINNNIYDLSSTSVSVWGDENHQFDSEGWFSNMENNN